MNDAQQDFKKAMIRLVINEQLDERLSTIDRDIELHKADPFYTLTTTEQQRIRKDIQHGLHRSQRRFRMRNAITFAAAIALLTLLASAFYPSLRRIWLKDFGGYTRVSISDDVTSDWDDAYEPRSFPSNYSNRSIQINRSQRIITYAIDGKPLTFNQCRDGNLGIDTEIIGKANRVFTNGFEGWLTENDDANSLYWTQDGFLFALTGDFPESELLATAQSVQDT